MSTIDILTIIIMITFPVDPHFDLHSRHVCIIFLFFIQYDTIQLHVFEFIIFNFLFFFYYFNVYE